MYVIYTKHKHGKSYWNGNTSPLDHSLGALGNAKKYDDTNIIEGMRAAKEWFQDRTHRGLMRYYLVYEPFEVEEISS